MRARPHTVWWSQDRILFLRIGWSRDGEERERVAWVWKGPFLSWRAKSKLRARA